MKKNLGQQYADAVAKHDVAMRRMFKALRAVERTRKLRDKLGRKLDKLEGMSSGPGDGP